MLHTFKQCFSHFYLKVATSVMLAFFDLSWFYWGPEWSNIIHQQIFLHNSCNFSKVRFATFWFYSISKLVILKNVSLVCMLLYFKTK
jgi:hypothetical protein